MFSSDSYNHSMAYIYILIIVVVVVVVVVVVIAAAAAAYIHTMACDRPCACTMRMHHALHQCGGVMHRHRPSMRVRVGVRVGVTGQGRTVQ